MSGKIFRTITKISGIVIVVYACILGFIMILPSADFDMVGIVLMMWLPVPLFIGGAMLMSKKFSNKTTLKIASLGLFLTAISYVVPFLFTVFRTDFWGAITYTSINVMLGLIIMHLAITLFTAILLLLKSKEKHPEQENLS